MIKQHRYRITIEPLTDAASLPPGEEKPLQFEVGSHDDLLVVVERVRQRGEFDEASSAAFAVGLKLFSEVMLEHRENALFREFRPHFSEFMKKLKQGAPARGA